MQVGGKGVGFDAEERVRQGGSEAASQVKVGRDVVEVEKLRVADVCGRYVRKATGQHFRARMAKQAGWGRPGYL